MGNYSAVRQFTHYPNIRRCTAEALQYGKKRCKKVPNEELHRATKRVIDTLEQLTAAPPQGMTLTELASALKAPKSSLFPIVHTLCELHMLSLNSDTGRYCIGYKAYEIGNVYLRRGGLTTDIQTQMHTIVEACGETCYFAQLVDGDVFYLYKVDSTEPVRSVVSPGQRLPAYATGIGKALLSGKSKDELKRLYPDGLKALTPNTITDIDRLSYQLDEIQRNGLAFECEQSTQYIRCVAVPIRRDGGVIAAMSIAMPVFRYDPEKEALTIRLLREAQLRLEKLLKNADFNGIM